MAGQPRLSVVIPSYNKADVLLATLEALRDQSIDRDTFEVIVVDDGSTDGTRRMVEAFNPGYPFRFVRQENQGAGAARNMGASLAEGELLLFLDSDIVLEPDALAVHVSRHDQHDRVIITGRILPLDPNPIGIEDLLFQTSFDFGPAKRVLPWNSALTQSLSVKASHFQQIGAFATDLPRGQDIEFGYRAAHGGFAILYCPEALGRHNHPMTLDQRCTVERRNHRQLVRLAQKRPDFVADFGYLRHKWPIAWRRDSWPVVLRKAARRALAQRGIITILRLGWSASIRLPLPARLYQRLYWAIIGSYQTMGLDDGIRDYGPVPEMPHDQ